MLIMSVLKSLLLVFLSLPLIMAKPIWLPQADVNETLLASIDRVYLVSSCHLDLGFADTLVNIVNLYFDKYFPNAIALGEELLQLNKEERLVFTTHSYLVWLYLNCPPESGLHCPDGDAILDFKQAVSNGIIQWHAFPFNAQPEVYDRSMMDFGFKMTMNISKELGFVPVAMSQRDVPGLTRSVIPLMKAHGVDAITVGVNTACMPPAVPTAFVWEDQTSGTQVIGMWHPHGYGDQLRSIKMSDMVIVPGMSTALAFAIRSDNTGPPSKLEVYSNYENLHTLFPNAEIIASSYNEFVEELVAHKDLLPVVTEEIGDTWIHGAASDPWKTVQFREMLRLRYNCLEINGSCSLDDSRIYGFSAFLLKYGEHTWGKDIKRFLHDTTNWSNEKFHSVQNAENFIDVVDSWKEQRAWSLEYALDALEDHPLKSEIKTSLDQLYFDGQLNMDGFESTSCDNVEYDNVSMSFDNGTMAIVSLQDKRGTETREFAGLENPLGAITYTTYTAEDFKEFLEHYLLDPSPNYAYQDLGKPGLEGTDHIVDFVNLDSCWIKTEQSQITFRVNGHFSMPESVTEYGASQGVAMDIRLPATLPLSSDPLSIDLTVYIINKTSTRIPESLSLLFKPNTQLVDATSLAVSKLGEYVLALDVINNGSKHVHGSYEGVKYGDPVPFSVVSLDAPIVSIGGDNFFPVPMEVPNVKDGFAFNIFNNLWGTNYIMWYPYLQGEESGKYRFTVTLPPVN